MRPIEVELTSLAFATRGGPSANAPHPVPARFRCDEQWVDPPRLGHVALPQLAPEGVEPHLGVWVLRGPSVIWVPRADGFFPIDAPPWSPPTVAEAREALGRALEGVAAALPEHPLAPELRARAEAARRGEAPSAVIADVAEVAPAGGEPAARALLAAAIDASHATGPGALGEHLLDGASPAIRDAARALEAAVVDGLAAAVAGFLG